MRNIDVSIYFHSLTHFLLCWLCALGGIFDQRSDNEPEVGKSLPEIIFEYATKHVNKERDKSLPKIKAGIIN